MYEEKIPTELNQIFRVIPHHIRKLLSQAVAGYADAVHEVVLRCGRPVCIYVRGEEMYLTENGRLTHSINCQPVVLASNKDVTDCFNISCGYSVYSHLKEIKEGYITLCGGHRVGISGTAVVSGGNIVNIRDISTISLRLARQIKGCGEEIAKIAVSDNKGILICGSPCSGKTTVLRDVSRLLSTVYKQRVSVIDTRGELAAVAGGASQMDLGVCDIFDGYPRVQGIEQALRGLSPDCIVCDELGAEGDVEALLSAVNSGVRFISTIHASTKKELLRRKFAKELLETNAFGKIVFLKGRNNPGVISECADLEELCDD